MDLGTIYTRLSSRNYYSTAGQYFDDLRLMCQNAMLYNPPDTIYYQKARKMLSFAEKQMSPQGLRKFAAELLKTSRPLTDEEMGISISETPKQNHHRGSHHGHHGHRHHQEDAQPGLGSRYSTSMSVPKLKEEILEKSDEVEDYAARSVEREELDGTPSSSYSSQLKRRPSNASLSSASATKVSRYANSPPHLIPEVDESFAGRIDSPRTQSTCGRSDAITIDLENAEGDQVDYSFGASPGSSSTISSSANRSSRRPARNVTSRRSSSTTKRVAPNQRQSCTSSRSRRRLAATAAVEQRTYAEDAWTFTDTMTDRTPPDQVIVQVKIAAENARAKHLQKFGQPGRQTVVYLDTSETGMIYAKPCDSGGGNVSLNSLEGWETGRKLVNYPLAMRQLLTPRAKSTGMLGYHGLIEQMTSQQVATLHALSNLRYDPSEPIAMGIHGPLAIFEKDELAQMIDAYGGASDLTVVESVLSLLTFVEPIGVEARRVAHLRLADATDGYHARMLISFADPESPYCSSNWMKRANLTIDPSIVEEFKTKFEEEIAEKTADAASLISNEGTSATTTSSVSLSVNELQTLNEESVSGSNATASGGQMSIAKLPSNTLTTSTTDKQMTAFQPQQNSAEEAEITSNEQDEENRKDEEEEEGEESFDILTEALNAAIVTPSDRNQPVLPDAVTVNELAQISALTAAISPIQQNFIPLPTSPIQHSPGVPTTSAVSQNIPLIVSGGAPISTPIPLSIIGQSGETKFIPVLASGTQIYSPGVTISSIPPQITPVPTPLQMGNTPICQSELAQNVEPNSLPVQEVNEKAEPLNILMSTSPESPQSLDTQICQSAISQEIDIASVPGVSSCATVPFQEGQNLHVMEKPVESSNIPESIQSRKTQAYRLEEAEKRDVQESSKPDISSFNPNVLRVNSPHVEMSESQNSLEEPNANLVPGETPETTLKSVASVQELLESSCAQDQVGVDDKRKISLLSESQEISTNPSQQPLLTGSIQSNSGGAVSQTTIFQGNQSVAVVKSSVGPLDILLVEHLHSPETQTCQSEFITTNVAKESSEEKPFSLNPTSISGTSLPYVRSNGSVLSKDMENIPSNMLCSEDVDQKSIETSILQAQLIKEENAENSLEETQQKSLYECSSEEALEDSEDKLNAGIQVGSHEIGSPEHQQKGLGKFDVEDQSECSRMYLGDSQQESFSAPVPIKPTAENESGSSEMNVNEVESNYDDHGTDQESISQPQIYDQKPSDNEEMHSDLSSEARKCQQEFLDIESAKDLTEPRSNEHLTEVRKELYQESTEENSHLMDIDSDSNPNLQEFEGPLAENKEEVFANDSSTNDLQLGLVDASEDLGYSNDLIPAVSHIEPSSMGAYTINSPSKVCNELSEDYSIVTVAKQDINSDLREPVDSSISDDKRVFVRVAKSPNIISDSISAEILVESSKESLDSSPPESNSNIQEPVAVQKDFVQEIISGKVNAETSESQFEYSISKSHIESGRTFKLQKPAVLSENDANSLEPPESFDNPSETTHLISAQNDSFVVPETKSLESSQVFYEENQSKDHSGITTIHSPDEQWNVVTESPTANQLDVENFSVDQNSVESSIPSILPCDNASIQLDPIVLLPTFETSNSPVSTEPFNPQQANLDEDAQTGYPHSNTSLERGGGLVDYDYTDSSASGPISSSSPSYV
ncbi:unnamed protein product [Hymenolepis diminuta]|nr:unnamed protein product [Hymenolepis diminuta]